jgi:hypothetical protein
MLAMSRMVVIVITTIFRQMKVKSSLPSGSEDEMDVHNDQQPQVKERKPMHGSNP